MRSRRKPLHPTTTLRRLFNTYAQAFQEILRQIRQPRSFDRAQAQSRYDQLDKIVSASAVSICSVNRV
jgi:hypothetical protein